MEEGGLLVKQVGFAQEVSLASRRVRSGRKENGDEIKASNYSTTSAGLVHNCGCRLICALCRESDGLERWDDGKKWFEWHGGVRTAFKWPVAGGQPLATMTARSVFAASCGARGCGCGCEVRLQEHE